MSAEVDFGRFARPELGRLFQALNLDVTYRRGRGDRLMLEPVSGTGTADQVLDLVGGAGSSLFGHNHPALVAAARRCLDEQLPFNAQASIRPGAAALAAKLSALVKATTGVDYVVTLGSTGADAVEAAVKHAVVERRRRLGALREELERSLRRLRRDGLADIPCGSGPAAGRPCGEVVTEAVEKVVDVLRAEPVLVSLRDAFHGKTTAAGTLTHGANVPEDLHVPGPRRVRLADWTPEAVLAALDDRLVEVCTVDVDAEGCRIRRPATCPRSRPASPSPFRARPGYARCRPRPWPPCGTWPTDTTRCWCSTRSSAAWAEPGRSWRRSRPEWSPTTTCCRNRWVGVGQDLGDDGRGRPVRR
ncbi:hypothetical protein GCM10029963_05150 [Micromonospora andamanensis]